MSIRSGNLSDRRENIKSGFTETHVDDFYGRLPAIHDLIEVTNSQRFTRVPQDWCIAIADIVESTKETEARRYQEANLVGTCSSTEVLNIADKPQLPFVFGVMEQ